MGWRRAKRRPVDNGITGIEDINNAFTRVVEESSGHLDEHNFTLGAFPSLDNLENDVYCRVYRVRHESITVSNGVSPNEPSPSATDRELVKTSSWKTTGLSKVFTSDTAVLWILVSLMFSCEEQSAGIVFALRLDGVVLEEGSPSKTDDNNQKTHYDRDQEGNALGKYRWAGTLAIEGLEQVAPGTHEVELVYKMPPFSNTSDTPDPRTNRLHSRELTIVELLNTNA